MTYATSGIVTDDSAILVANITCINHLISSMNQTNSIAAQDPEQHRNRGTLHTQRPRKYQLIKGDHLQKIHLVGLTSVCQILNDFP